MHGDIEAKDCIYVFNNWQEVANCSIWDQPRLMEFIKSCGRYELALEWSSLHVVNNKCKLLAISMQLIYLLNQNLLQEQQIYKILDELENNAVEYAQLCELVLPEIVNIEGKFCFIKYIIKLDLEEEQLSYYLNMYFGLKMLSSLNEVSKESYSSLEAHPYLILEQMLMNIELKDAEKALEAISEDLNSEIYGFHIISTSSINQLVEDYASKALEVHFLDALLESSSSSTLVLSVEETLVSDEPFIMPPQVPSKEEWVPDAKIHRCQVCKEERFSMFSRRHHCRRCGRVICANCSQHALKVEGYGNVQVRVCDDCYNIMTGSFSFNTSSFEKRFRALSSMKSSPHNSPFQNIYPGVRWRSSSIHSNQIFRWLLSSDSELNASIRNEFSYEQAPSISLCFSILKLHSDAKKCADFMLNLCDRLLGKIKPRHSGKLSTEVDYNLVISMIKSLLVNAKVKCHQEHYIEGEALADLYFQHLDIVKLLVNSNCRHLIPRNALINSDTVRKLRDKLLEEERMQLALEVSTKFNLDKSGVWSTWGLFCLRAGDWITAREKFQQCLKIPQDKNSQKQESPLLNKILDCLENSKNLGNEKAAALNKSLASLNNIQNGLIEVKKHIVPLDHKIKKECLFYLIVYGTHFSTVKFYQKHGLIHEALDYIIDQKCEPDIFIKAFFMPVLKSLQFSTLKYLLSSADPSLAKWWPYLFSTCRHLERIKYLNVLYEMQLFMEDYIRAAKSAINFYLAPASSYKTLFERTHFLKAAKEHLQNYLQNFMQENSAKELWKKNKNILALPLKEVESYIQTITLQEKVSSFFQLASKQSIEIVYDEMNSSEENEVSSLPTLFGNIKKKSELVLMILLIAIKLDDGFDLAAQIMQIYNLDATSILISAGKKLIDFQEIEQIPHFLTCMKCCFANMVKIDEVILECISAINAQGKDVEELIKMLATDNNKINAYLMCEKLKSAYLLAIKKNSAHDVLRVMVAAEQSGQDSVQRFCKTWLDTNSSKLKTRHSTFSFK